MHDDDGAHDDPLGVQKACGRAHQGLGIRLTAVIREGPWIRLEEEVVQQADIVEREELAGACRSPSNQAPPGLQV